MTATVITATQVKAGLIYSQGFIWGGNTITYSIPGTTAVWTGGYGNGEPTDPDYGTFNATQAANYRAAVEIWDSYIDSSMNEVSDATPGDLRIAFTELETRAPGAAAYGYSPPSPGFGGDPDNGDIWVDDAYKSNSFAKGTSGFELLLHELGHTLGLKHPFDNPTLPDKFDFKTYSVMSYTAEDAMVTFKTTSGGGIQSNFVGTVNLTPMVLDIMAIQAHYGADKTTNAGNNVYIFRNGDLGGRQAIYDAGGTDSIDLSRLTRGSVLDLRPGAYSDVAKFTVAQQIESAVAKFGEGFRSFIEGQYSGLNAYEWERNVGIAFSTVIENATGSGKADTIIGNSVANTIRGGGGKDSITGGLGNDRMFGGTGGDTFVFSNGSDKDRIGDFTTAFTNHDKLDLRNLSSITSLADLKASHLDFVSGNATIDAGGGDVITLVGVSAASQLHSYNFLF